MIFKKCSIGGKVYNGDDTTGTDTEQIPPSAQRPPPVFEDKERGDIFTNIPLNEIPYAASSSADAQKVVPAGTTDILMEPKTSGDSGDTVRAPPKVVHHFRDAELTRDLQASVQDDLDPAHAARARSLNGFFTVLALCHTVLTSVDAVTGELEYKAQSPDEAALVQAAADMGFVFRGREKEILLLQTPFGTQGSIDESHASGEGNSIAGAPPSMLSAGVPTETATGPHVGSGSTAGPTLCDEGTLERYELLNILEFTSARKRMSVILRKLDSEDGRFFLLCKGADNVIFERLKEGLSEELKVVTEEHLAEFAGQGLRTLTLAYKVVGGWCLFFLSRGCTPNCVT